MPDDDRHRQMLDTLKKAAAALRDAGVAFAVAGGFATWARGGPPSDHDVDLFVKKEDAERALETLAAQGMTTERPPEGWLLKAFDGDVLVDLIFEPAGTAVDDDMLARADELPVDAQPMLVADATTVVATKLHALTEHSLDYDGLIEAARALREQLDWDELRAVTAGSPFAKAFFVLAEELGVAPAGG